VQPALLITLIAASYLLLAGGPSWTRPILWAIAVLAAALVPRRTFSFPPTQRRLDLALLALIAAMAVQLIPLPSAVVAVVSPRAMALRQATRLGAASGWIPLTIDAAATAQAIASVALGVLVFWIARGAFSAGGSTRSFCRIIGWLAAAAAVIAVVQRATRPGLLMGMVVTEARNANPMGPFLNRNHFAAWLLLALAVSVGYLIAHLQIHPAYRMRFRMALRHFLASGALLFGICVLIMVGTLLMTLSRSAAAGLGAAAICGGWLGRSRLQIERSNMPRVLGAAGVALLILVTFIDVEGWFTRLQQSIGISNSDFDRLTIWRESLPMLRDFFLTGTGAGTYGQAMTHYQQSRFWIGAMQGWAHFNNAHSHYLQIACEGGLLLLAPALTAVAMLGTLGVKAIRADKGEMFWARVGAMAGLFGLAVQSIWEVALILPANAILFGALAGLLLYRRETSRPSTTAGLRPV
jgi:O-antigen ligase